MTQEMTLDQYASGINTNNYDLQRQSKAFGYLRQLIAQIETLAADPSKQTASLGALPILTMRIPTEGEMPDEVEFPLNTLLAAKLYELKPLFEMMAATCGDDLIQAWNRIFALCEPARQIVESATAQSQVHTVGQDIGTP
jgi:hypothetical protein